MGHAGESCGSGRGGFGERRRPRHDFATVDNRLVPTSKVIGERGKDKITAQSPVNCSRCPGSEASAARARSNGGNFSGEPSTTGSPAVALINNGAFVESDE